MISSKSSAPQSERAESLRAEVTETLIATLASLRQYVVPTDPSVVEQFQSWADTMIDLVQRADGGPDQVPFDELRTNIRGGLRDYRDRAEGYMNEIRTRIATTTSTLRVIAASLQSGESKADAQINEEIARLRSVKELTSLQTMRVGVEHSMKAFVACMTQLKQEKDGIISQLSNEIRALQNSVEKARRAAKMEVITELCDRQELERLVKEEVMSGNPFSAIRLTLQNFPQLTTWYQPPVIDQLIGAFCKRARGVIPEDAPLGRWRENTFYVLLPPSDTAPMMGRLAQKCGGNYVCMDGPYARTLYLHLAPRNFTFPPGTSASTIIQKLDNAKAK